MTDDNLLRRLSIDRDTAQASVSRTWFLLLLAVVLLGGGALAFTLFLPPSSEAQDSVASSQADPPSGTVPAQTRTSAILATAATPQNSLDSPILDASGYVVAMRIATYCQNEQNMFGIQPRSAATTAMSLQAGDRYNVDVAQLENWVTQRNGILIQRRVAEQFELEVGDSFPLIAPGVQKEDGTNLWEFVVSGIYSYTNPDENPMEAVFH